jgi:hypothetical protein
MTNQSIVGIIEEFPTSVNGQTILYFAVFLKVLATDIVFSHPRSILSLGFDDC